MTRPFLTSSGKDRILVYSVRRIGEDTRWVMVGADSKAAGNSLDSVRHCSSPRGVKSGSLYAYISITEPSGGFCNLLPSLARQWKSRKGVFVSGGAYGMAWFSALRL